MLSFIIDCYEMKKISILLLVFVSVQCFGQDIIRQKRIDMMVKSFCDRSYNYDIDRMLLYTQVDRILSLKEYANEILSCYNPKTFDLGDYYIMCFFDSIPQSVVDTAFAYSNKYAGEALFNRLLVACVSYKNDFRYKYR